MLTGVASRYVGYFISGMLVILGLFPGVASFVQLIPEPVLGGATIVMFGTIAAAGRTHHLSCRPRSPRNPNYGAVVLDGFRHCTKT